MSRPQQSSRQHHSQPGYRPHCRATAVLAVLALVTGLSGLAAGAAGAAARYPGSLQLAQDGGDVLLAQDQSNVLLAQDQSNVLLAQDGGEIPVTDPAISQAIRSLISDQLAAFRRDDAAAAFNDASPFIQSRFQQPDIFLQVVRSGYAPVYRPQQVEFRDLVQTADGLEQRVFVMGPDGRAYLAHYQMQRQPDGGWKINGCTLEPLGDQNT